MSFTDFFLKRPVFAIVINLMIIVIGLLSYSNLGLREYPKVSNPIYEVVINYPSASAEIVEQEITTPLEDHLGGLEGLDQTSSSSMYGQSKVQLTFKAGTDLAAAQSSIRDALALAKGALPDEAKEPIVNQQESDAEPFLYISLRSDQASFAEMTHVANVNLKNPFKTIEGVAKVDVMGQPYTMNISLNNAKMLQHGIGPDRIYQVLKEYNVSLPAGRYHESSPITVDLTATNVEDFSQIPVREHQSSIVLLKDVADIELGFQDENITRINGQNAVILGIIKTSDGNPLTISDAVRNRIPEFQKLLPSHIKMTLDFDKTKFIRGSLSAIKSTILEAIALVILIVFLFLRNFRSVLIPLVAIPLSLIGVMSLMSVFGLSINTITLLAMVLAVGLVVDDAIVVLENIHRHIEGGRTPSEAALIGAREIGFAIIAMTFTLASVYAPVALISDTIGQIFFEFAVTLAGAVFISGIVALTFSPLMCATLLKKNETHYLPKLDSWLTALETGYRHLLDKTLAWPRAVLLTFVGLMVACVGLFTILPQSLTPQEDRGVIGVWVPPLAGASLTEFDDYIHLVENVTKRVTDAEINLTFGGAWGAQIFCALKPWSDREKSAAAWVEVMRAQLGQIPTIQAYPWSWDSGIPGVEQVSSRGGGLSLYLQTTDKYTTLKKYADQMRQTFDEMPAFEGVYHDLKLDTPGFTAVVDRHRLALSGIKPAQAALILSVMFDKNTGLEFKKDGIRYPIALINKDTPSFLEEIYAINAENKPVPLSAFMHLDRNVQPRELKHFNQLRSAGLNLTLVNGYSLDQGIEIIKNKSAEILPSDIRIEFSGVAKKLQESSSTMLLLIAVALLFIFFILSIQFESFIDPLIIMFTVPLAGLGALILLWLTGGMLDIYTQVGLITLIGLISKHGILIVEFANQKLHSGVALQDAVAEATRLRLRPILMTTGAMVFGAIPLIIATGPGSEARYAIGLVLVGGLTIGTVLTLFIIPSIYIQTKKWAGMN